MHVLYLHVQMNAPEMVNVLVENACVQLITKEQIVAEKFAPTNVQEMDTAIL